MAPIETIRIELKGNSAVVPAPSPRFDIAEKDRFNPPKGHAYATLR